MIYIMIYDPVPSDNTPLIEYDKTASIDIGFSYFYLYYGFVYYWR